MDSGRGEAAEWPLPLEVEVGAGDESRTRDPGCPEGSTLLGKHRVRLAMLSKQPSYHFSSRPSASEAVGCKVPTS